MFNGVYSGAAAMHVATKQHEVIANNLANANVPGFRRTMLAVSTRGINQATGNGDVQSDLRGNKLIRTHVDFTMGPLKQTGRSLDFAINGEGFFSIDTPQGVRYTRNGSFHLSEDGNLVTSAGDPVSGGIQVPSDIAVSDLTLDSEGSLRANGTEVGKLNIVTFDDLDQLIQTGPTQFEAPAQLASQPSDAVIAQGTLESSNASVIHEMIGMIVGMRHFEAAQQSLKSISDVIQQFTTFDG